MLLINQVLREMGFILIWTKLVDGYERVRKQNAVGLRVFLEYGCWLGMAYELFRLKKWKGQNGGSVTWQEWLTVNVGICPRYSQMLREVAKLLQN